jgi:hypothetical protein
MSAHRLAERGLVPDVTVDDPQPLVRSRRPGSIAHEYRDVVAGFEGLGHDVPPRCAGGAEYQKLRDRANPSTLGTLGTQGTLGTLVLA